MSLLCVEDGKRIKKRQRKQARNFLSYQYITKTQLFELHVTLKKSKTSRK